MPASFRIKTLTGEPVIVKGAQLRLRSQVLQLRFPFIQGGLIWNRPIAVLVHTADGRDQIMPIPDVTRTVVLMLLLFSLAGTFLLRLFRRKTT